jgi:hypothetical protein
LQEGRGQHASHAHRFTFMGRSFHTVTFPWLLALKKEIAHPNG